MTGKSTGETARLTGLCDEHDESCFEVSEHDQDKDSFY